MDFALLQAQPRHAVDAGTILVVEGQPVQGIYFLESGEVEVRKDGMLIAEVYEPGAVFGDMAFLLETVPTATVKTTVPSVFRHVPNPREFFRQNPDYALHTASILARRLDSLNRYLVDIKHQFKDRADHLGIIDEVLDALMHKHPRKIPRREAGD
jgi:CRP-like cAMP-binding protein